MHPAPPLRRCREDRRFRRRRGWTVAYLLLAVTSAAGCGNTDDRPPTWTYISPALFQPSCATQSCHSRGAAAAGLDLSDAERGYASLTTLSVSVTSAQGVVTKQPRVLVVAHDPAQSRLVNVLRARGALRMPPDRPLPQMDIALVESWILDGARQTFDGPPAGAAP